MQQSSLTSLAHELLAAARDASSGRSARTVYGGHARILRQTLIALAAGQALENTRTPARRPSKCYTGGST